MCCFVFVVLLNVFVRFACDSLCDVVWSVFLCSCCFACVVVVVACSCFWRFVCEYCVMLYGLLFCVAAVFMCVSFESVSVVCVWGLSCDVVCGGVMCGSCA